MRKGLDGSELAIATEYIAYSVAFAFGTLLLGIAVFKRWEAKVVKYL